MTTAIHNKIYQTKEIFWKERSLSNLISNINRHFEETESNPAGFTRDEYISLKKECRSFLTAKFNRDFSLHPVIASGHQPEFHHPGIVFKDLMVWKIAGLLDGIPLHVIVDTDLFELSYTYPVSKENGKAEIKKWHVVNEDHRIYKDTRLSTRDRLDLIEILKSQLSEIPKFLENPSECLSIINKKIEALESESCIQVTNEIIRDEYLSARGIHIHGVNVSQLAALPAFYKLVEVIKNRITDFRTVYNSALAEYRQLHKIKNHAQPIPDLAEGEMPFWILDEENDIRKVMHVNDSIDSAVVLPRAVTLTLFLRLFISDFFIHGKGGGRYEEVSEHILKEFFEIDPAPFEVASATMHLEPRSGHILPELSEKDLDLKLRDAVYSPEKFLEPDHDFVLQKKALQEKFKDPNSNKKELNSKIQELNEKMKLLIGKEKEKLEKMKQELPELLKTKMVFNERTFPFYYYEMDELVDFVKGLE